MLDIKFVRDNIEEVQKNIEKRSVKADAQLVVDLYKRKNELQLEIDELRKARNDNAAKMKQKLTDDERAKLVEEGKTLKAKIAEIEEESKKIDNQYIEEAMKLPNMTNPTSPIGVQMFPVTNSIT